jgi:hypothetical protein
MSRTVPHAVESDHDIREIALSLFRALRERRRIAVRLIGVGASNLMPPASPLQAGLFDEIEGDQSARRSALSRVTDEVRRRHGPDSIRTGPA